MMLFFLHALQTVTNALLWKCFDLRNFIDTNKCVSYNRWRCASCEKFVSLQNLQICGLTSHLLKEFKTSTSSERDRIEYSSDGRYKLLEQQVSRHKKRLESTLLSTNTKVSENAMAANDVEIIDSDWSLKLLVQSSKKKLVQKTSNRWQYRCHSYCCCGPLQWLQFLRLIKH